MLQCDTLDHLTPSLCFLSRQYSFKICGHLARVRLSYCEA